MISCIHTCICLPETKFFFFLFSLVTITENVFATSYSNDGDIALVAVLIITSGLHSWQKLLNISYSRKLLSLVISLDRVAIFCNAKCLITALTQFCLNLLFSFSFKSFFHPLVSGTRLNRVFVVFNVLICFLYHIFVWQWNKYSISNTDPKMWWHHQVQWAW